MSKYLTFMQIGTSTSGKTTIWEVRSKKHGDLLGNIKWYAPWRQYCFETHTDFETTWSAGCFKDIIKFLEWLNKTQKEKRRGNQNE